MPLLLGSSTALVAVLDYASRKPTGSSKSTWVEPSISAPDLPMPEPVIKIAHLGDCMGMLVRGEEVVWRSEEMWSNFNTPLQLGPASSTRPADAQVFTIPVQTDDILILASDGLSDNLWDEEVLDEVIRFRRSFLHPGRQGLRSSLLGRRALAGMLSEALCSRARKVSERPPRKVDNAPGESKEMETPFARKAREQGRWFSGGKSDGESFLVRSRDPLS
ncbi:hypothetical protein GLOTRDRAFT_45575 [Gloeophyllum trabeum ATCC 11539]|uniref:Protein phosphatase n=1 Tax=Gloeophyllum trabeum (strain ATCC 11539 / FP-39264 / Madison 617) TaxID=670483 RepID=S7Q105_GLOTA|nr:uncharacterized protein GLOTRDRAFT_45575 [Gloeophyllum trabeum ATCC 11539]EPQ53197.1 hypothetical protein GLOTRDRAFT_45575 [Gloeophyllum trabeum ATCC 11539]